MTMNRQGRPATPSPTPLQAGSISGSRGLLQREDLIFEIGTPDTTGVDLPAPKGRKNRLGGVSRKSDTGLPGLSEPEAVRHYVRLSQRNYAIDLGLFPLGSCTMKHNPRLNEKLARLPGFADIHPLQPQATVQGALELIDAVATWLKTLTGMPAVAMSPRAGAHGELCGMLAIRQALIARGEDKTRRRVLVPASAHGTNPATAVQCGFLVDEIKANARGRVDMAELREKLQKTDDIAGIMLTNPNTCGLFETDIREIADLIHAAGGYFYCDGANFNAIVGRVRPGDLGIDAMHINLHKTFSTPHGGGGPGSGPTVLSAALAPFAPVPWILRDEDGIYRLAEDTGVGEAEQSFGRMAAFHGQMGMFVRALAYMLSHGADGLKQAAEDAVLNANYIQARLKPVMSPAFDGFCMHEALFSDAFTAEGIETIDIAKALIDEGYHPMTMYFPLVVHGAMLIEPTETESKAELDRFCEALEAIARRAADGDMTMKQAPERAPMRRLDETRAARRPVLRWTPPSPERVAAE